MTNFLSAVLENFLYWLPLILCAIGALIIFLMKYITFYRAKSNVYELITGLKQAIPNKQFIEAIHLCENSPGPVPRMLGAAVHAYSQGDDVREALETQAMLELPRLESFFTTYATITIILPLAGLLSTTVKLIKYISHAEVYDAQKFAQDVSLSLSFAAVGLGLAILCYIGQAILNACVSRFCSEMEIAAADIIYITEHSDKKDGSDADSEK